jgi:hypothetical protein
LTPVVVQKWYYLGGLDGKAPLNTGKNKSLLLSYEMDCNKPCMPDRSGTMKKVPHWRRTERWGFSEEERATKKKTGALMGDASERRVPPAADEEDGDAQVNTLGHVVPGWYIAMHGGEEGCAAGSRAFEKFVPRSTPPAGGTPPHATRGTARIVATQEDWDNHYRAFPGKDKCAMVPAHNKPDALERMKANGQTRCPCVTGVNLAGVKFGDDYSEQATEEEMRKLWSEEVTIHTEKERRWHVEELTACVTRSRCGLKWRDRGRRWRPCSRVGRLRRLLRH